jgi:hypothetical protein
MNTLTKLALGLIGHNRPRPAEGDGTPAMRLPPPRRDRGLPLMQALARRQSRRGAAWSRRRTRRACRRPCPVARVSSRRAGTMGAAGP